MPKTDGFGLRRAILYARVSTDEQAKSGYSLAQQIEALRDYAAREGYEILEEVRDAGQSGDSLERPGMDRVRDLVAAGGVSLVLAVSAEADETLALSGKLRNPSEVRCDTEPTSAGHP